MTVNHAITRRSALQGIVACLGTARFAHAAAPSRELYLGQKPSRPSWDPIAVLYAVRSHAPFWRRRSEGYNHIFPNGTNEWRSEPDSAAHVLLELVPGAEGEVGRTIDELIVQPPRHRAG